MKNTIRIIICAVSAVLIVVSWISYFKFLYKSDTMEVNAILISAEHKALEINSDGSIIEEGVHYTVEYSVDGITYTNTYFYSNIKKYGSMSKPVFTAGSTITYHVFKHSPWNCGEKERERK